MKNSKIKKILGKEILDSKGMPTVEVKLETDLGKFSASVPSGASKGKYEAVELRDGGKRYHGMGVLKAVKNINKIIAPKLIGKNPLKQKEIDNFLLKLDGTKQKSKLGGNSILAVSIAVLRAGAKAQKMPLWRWISLLSKTKPNLPTPAVLCIEGGLHGKGNLDVQEFMVAPNARTFKERFETGKEIYQILGRILSKKYGKSASKTGLEGAFLPPLKNTEEVLSLIAGLLREKAYKNVKIFLDVASSSFFTNGKYHFEKRVLDKEELLSFYLELYEKYPIGAIEDPFSQDDWEGWRRLNVKCKVKNEKLLIIGDDLLATNPKRIKIAKAKNACNAAVIKPNQIGTVSETIEAAKLAKSFGWKIVVSHRSGETSDDFIADLAVGIGADFIKSGAPFPKERMAKYNRLLEIEEELHKN